MSTIILTDWIGNLVISNLELNLSCGLSFSSSVTEFVLGTFDITSLILYQIYSTHHTSCKSVLLTVPPYDSNIDTTVDENVTTNVLQERREPVDVLTLQIDETMNWRLKQKLVSYKESHKIPKVQTPNFHTPNSITPKQYKKKTLTQWFQPFDSQIRRVSGRSMFTFSYCAPTCLRRWFVKFFESVWEVVSLPVRSDTLSELWLDAVWRSASILEEPLLLICFANEEGWLSLRTKW